MLNKSQDYPSVYQIILSKLNKPGFAVFMPTDKFWYENHLKCYCDLSFEEADCRAHGWCDLIVKNQDQSKYYYKFIELEDKIYKGWLKKWKTLPENHIVVLYYYNKSNRHVFFKSISMRDFVPDYNCPVETDEYFLFGNMPMKGNQVYELDLNDGTKTLPSEHKIVKAIRNCIKYQADRRNQYLLHKSSGFKYKYKGWYYVSLKALWEKHFREVGWNTFRSRVQRGKYPEIVQEETV